MPRRQKQPVMVDGVVHWQCVKCQVVKAPAEFHRRKLSSNGLHASCRECRRPPNARTYRSRGRGKEPILIDGIPHWKCSKCREAKPSQYFEAYAKSSNGLLSHCRECRLSYNAEYQKKNKEQLKAKSKKRRSSKEGRDKDKAIRTSLKGKTRIALREAVKQGKATRPNSCRICGSDEGVIEAHHSDYNKPFDVVWFCRTCHRSEHKRLRRTG